MNYINIFGSVFMIFIMVPNVIFSVKCKEEFQNICKNKVILMMEQVGRICCFCFMILIIPKCRFGFSSDKTFALYLIVNTILILLYCFLWIILFKQNNMLKALALSIIPSIIFIFSAVISNYIPLLISSLIFAPCHITISYKNAKIE